MTDLKPRGASAPTETPAQLQQRLRQQRMDAATAAAAAEGDEEGEADDFDSPRTSGPATPAVARRQSSGRFARPSRSRSTSRDMMGAPTTPSPRPAAAALPLAPAGEGEALLQGLLPGVSLEPGALV